MCFSKILNASNNNNISNKMSMSGVEFTKEELKSLIEDEKSCVHLKRCEYSLALYPSHLENFNESIKELLNQKKAKYVKELGGILLGYRKIKLLSSDGAIVNDSCFIHIDIEADFYVFKPELGSILKGIVNKVSDNHLGCLVHRLFNISVPKLDEGEKWLGNYVDIGHEVVLNITHIDLHSRLPYIRATLDETQFENTTAMKVRKIEVNSEISNEITETPIVKKKRHKSHSLSFEESVENKIENLDETTETTIIHKKKKHKKKDREEQNDEIDSKPQIKIENGDSIEKKKHKKNHKKEKERDRDSDKQNLEIVNVKIKKEKKEKRKSLENDSKQSKRENNESIVKNRHSLNLPNLNGFIKTEIPDISFHSQPMADLEDRKKSKKRKDRTNISSVSIDDIKLDIDSDLEKILHDSKKSKKKKHKQEKNESFEQINFEKVSEKEKSSKKRKREESFDEDFNKKHKKKRHSVTKENL